MKRFYICILFLLFSQRIVNAQGTPSTVFIQGFPISTGKTLLQQCSRNSPQNIQYFWQVSDSTLSKLVLDMDTISTLASSQGYPQIKINKYGYQAIGITIKGEKYVYINAFRIGKRALKDDPFLKNWKKSPIIVCDGGTSFWGILYHVSSHQFSHLAVNGSS